MASYTSVERLSQGPLTVGSAARVRQPGLSAATYTVTELVPEVEFTWSSTTVGVRTTGRHVVQPRPDGRTALRLSIEQSGVLAGPSGCSWARRSGGSSPSRARACAPQRRRQAAARATRDGEHDRRWRHHHRAPRLGGPVLPAALRGLSFGRHPRCSSARSGSTLTHDRARTGGGWRSGCTSSRRWGAWCSSTRAQPATPRCAAPGRPRVCTSWSGS